MANEPNVKKSMHDIAELLRTPQTPDPKVETLTLAPKPEKVTPPEGNNDDEGTDPDEDAEDLDDGDDQDEADDQDDEGEDPSDEDEEEAGDDDAHDDTDDEGYVNISDDDLIEVKVDGEVVMRSIADAKKALSGEGAIDKRLKEATEARKKAQTDHTMLLEQFSVAHTNLMKTVSGMEDIVFQPVVAKPDTSLRASDPQKYLLAVDAYEADQKRVEEGRKAVRNLVQEQQKALQGDIQTYREQQTTALLQSIPALGDREKAPEVLKNMSQIAMEKYGYSPEEIQQASDHRLYRMIYDLMKFHDAREPATRKANTVKDLKGQSDKRPRKLRSGATALKSKARKNAEAQKKVTDQARQTGKVKDVAATLMRKG